MSSSYDAQVLHAETRQVEHHAEVSPQLNPESFSSQLFWLTLSFALLYVLVSRRALPAIQSVLETRRQRLAADLEAAEALSREAQAAQDAYEREQAEARLRANALVVEAQASHDQLARQEHAALDKTLAKKLSDADKALREQCTRIEKDLAPIAEEAAAMIVEKLLGKAPDAAMVKKAVKAASS
jgi:F-type H+-transporting ATPase subunit b